MYLDPFTKQSIYSEHFWNSSQCIWHENILMDFFRSMLIGAGYTNSDDSKKIWQCKDKTVIICLVDDVRSCSSNFQKDFPYLYNKNTTVITDNKITCPTQFNVMCLPKSFFGIYSNTAQNIKWEPSRDFTFAVNRLDSKRLEILLEIIKRNDINQACINFNCFQHNNNDPVQAFEQQWHSLPEETKHCYEDSYNHIKNLVPYRNYDFEHELAYYQSYLNIVVESYSSDHVIAFSEKIFRALTVPAPWTLFSGRYSVAYLESLGFDVLADLVDHNAYDRLFEDQNKVDAFVWQGNQAINKIKQMNFSQVRTRCQEAADHNTQLLKKLQQQWPKDFANWFDNLPSQLEL